MNNLEEQNEEHSRRLIQYANNSGFRKKKDWE
jgi:hypothetical protein